MKFDKSKVYTPFNCDEVKIGSKGYLADCKTDLIKRVIKEETTKYHTLVSIGSDDCPFKVENENCWEYFYLVEEPKEKTKRPCTREELIEMLKKQGLPMLKGSLSGANFIVTTTTAIFCYVYDCGKNSYHRLCERFTLLDGTELWVEE